MKCPECGGKTKVITVRVDSKNTVHRRKQCLQCNNIFFTKEYMVVMGDEFHRADSLYRNNWINGQT